MKPDSPTAAIVAALRQLGVSVEYHAGSAGAPDLIWGYRGRMGLAEVKAPGKEHGVCGCTSTDPTKCLVDRFTGTLNLACGCKGHDVYSGYGERRVYHRQLLWHSRWSGPPIRIWTSPDQAVKEVMG